MDLDKTNETPITEESVKQLTPKELKKAKQRRRQQKEVLKKKMRKQPVPKVDRMKNAIAWLENYNYSIQGNNIIRKYRKYFGIDAYTVYADLKELKYPLTERQIDMYLNAEKNKVIQAKRLKEKRRERKLKKDKIPNKFPNSGYNFYFIAGYTSGGAPYGVTWEKMGSEPFEDIFNCDVDD